MTNDASMVEASLVPSQECSNGFMFPPDGDPPNFLTLGGRVGILNRCRGVAQMEARRVWDAEVGGSSPPTPTAIFVWISGGGCERG